MKERPILFRAPMVRAILAGAKTQTRRVIKPQQPRETQPLDAPYEFELTERNGDVTLYTTEQLVDRCPHGKPGDRLWVRETHCRFTVGEGMDRPVPEYVAYRATHGDSFDYVNLRGETIPLTVTKWTPAIYMPRWASRITLDVTGVRVERLHEITEDDARAEGVEPIGRTVKDGVESRSYRQGFDSLWCTINGSDSWASNPWVWVVEFRRVEAAERAA